MTERKGPKDSIMCLRLCSPPGNTGLNFCGQMQLLCNCWLPGCVRWARKYQEKSSDLSQREQQGTSTNYCEDWCKPFSFCRLLFLRKLWLFYCCHASSNRASIVCLYGFSVFSWDPDKRLSGHEWLLCFPALKRSQANVVKLQVWWKKKKIWPGLQPSKPWLNTLKLGQSFSSYLLFSVKILLHSHSSLCGQEVIGMK